MQRRKTAQMPQKYTLSSSRGNTISNDGILRECFDTFSSKSGLTQTFINNYNQSCSINFPCCSFTGKEKDEETGYGYFGARYMDHELMTMWLSVDPMADKYPNISPYAYSNWNPVTIIDPDGRDGVPAINKREKSITVQVDIVFYMPNPGHIGRKTIDNWTKHLVSDINKEWNSRNWTYEYQGEKYSVYFDFSYWFDNKVHTDEDFKFDKKNNKKNYIELLGHSAYQYDKNSGKSIYKHRSKVRGGNTGLWYYDTKAAAHEAGHLLGLPDRYHEDSQAASGYSADPGWQGTIMAEPGGIGRVTQKDINDVLDRMLKTDKQ